MVGDSNDVSYKIKIDMQPHGNDTETNHFICTESLRKSLKFI